MAAQTETNVERRSRQIAHLLHPPLNDKEAAAYLGVSVQSLRNWRCLGRGPAYLKLSPGPRGRVKYQIEDLDEYKKRCRIKPMSP